MKATRGDRDCEERHASMTMDNSAQLVGCDVANSSAPRQAAPTSGVVPNDPDAEADAAAVFRDGMRKVASSVGIVTASFEGTRRGLTATAICSVSAEPPMLAVCINKSSSAHEVIRRASFFAVNILDASQMPIADAFGGRAGPDQRFATGEWHEGETGAPVLRGAVVTFECELTTIVDASSHTLFMGLVRAVHSSAATDPLLYHDRRYRHCS
ncbi:flavin reductase family protein [Bosea sp. NPDC055594]